MITMNIALDGNGCWTDLQSKEVIHLGDGSPPISVAILDAGLSCGRPSLAIRIDLPDGRVVVAETSARLFCTVARMIMAKYPDLLAD